MFECKCCGSNEFKQIYTDLPDRFTQHEGNFDYVGCKKCKLVQIRELPLDLKEFYRDYSLHQQHSKIYSLLRRLVVGHGYPLKKLHGGNMLDIGCGNGWYLKQMAKRGWTPFGYEFDKDFAKELSTRLSMTILSGEDALNDYSEYFDLVTFNSSFEHLPNPTKMLEIAYRTLKKRGRIFISVPNIRSREAHLFAERWIHLDPPRHICLFDKQQLSDLLARIGFQAIKVRNLRIPTGFAGSITYLFLGKFKPWLFYIAVPFGILFSLFIRDGYFVCLGTKADPTQNKS